LNTGTNLLTQFLFLLLFSPSFFLFALFSLRFAYEFFYLASLVFFCVALLWFIVL
jgi:hypothetical protein